MAPDMLEILRLRIQEAIGGRHRAPAFDRQTARRFKRTTLQSWIDGKTWPDVAELKALAAEVNKPVAWFLGLEETQARHPPLPDVVMVPILDVQAAAGAGRAVDVVKAEAEFAFPLYFLKKLVGTRAGSADLSALRARGDSMEPTIRDGALLIIDEAQRDLPNRVSSAKIRAYEPDIFVFLTSDGVRLKRLAPGDENFVMIISDNIDMYRQRSAARRKVRRLAHPKRRLETRF
jgi:phage repressor protein C with HTH and peptisase S24 domain